MTISFRTFVKSVAAVIACALFLFWIWTVKLTIGSGITIAGPPWWWEPICLIGAIVAVLVIGFATQHLWMTNPSITIGRKKSVIPEAKDVSK